MGRTRSILLLGCLIAPLGNLPAEAQIPPSSQSPFESHYLEPMPELSPSRNSPTLSFRLAREIPLPGPLPGGGPRWVEGLVEIEVAEGLARAEWADLSTLRIVSNAGEPISPPPAGATRNWVVTPDGKARFALSTPGYLLAEHRCPRCRAGWRPKWALRVAGDELAPPVVTDDRVFFGALDNRVYGLKRRNGHRLWEAELEGRVSRRLALWHAQPKEDGPTSDRLPSTDPLALVLATPDQGTTLVALDARNGAEVASFDLPEGEGKLYGSPLVTPDGKIVVARQKYEEAEASLMILDLSEPPKPSPLRGSGI